MITVAFDAATARCTVAATDGSRIAQRHIDGPRQHAAAIVTLLGDVIAELGAAPPEIGLVLTGDGPGSFTGLRVVAAVAKALVWHRPVAWHTAPSLLIRAAGHAPGGGGTVLALSNALRGELFAGCWRFDGAAVSAPMGAPRAMRPGDLTGFGRVDIVVGSVPPDLVQAVEAATGARLVGGDDALPDAIALLALDRLTGGTSVVADPAAWQPAYGRLAEAQVVWERAHGQPLPTASGTPR
jgi:tRNA threonylcarbamoyladenosine biosynthesis protein TsaB